MDTLGFEPRAFRMRSGCDTTTPCAPLGFQIIHFIMLLICGKLKRAGMVFEAGSMICIQAMIKASIDGEDAF
jgi:hypothetical protein